jgi:hypothetical protein
MTGMDDADSPKAKESWWPAAIGVALLTLPVGYVLSFGPFLWLLDGDYVPKNSIVIYKPLVSLAESWPTFDKLLRWYINLWL